MSNWFQDHPSTSIVTYTLVVAGASWAASTFILQDNRMNLAKSELESQRTLSEQYKAKVELLQKDIEVIRAENQEYRNWLSQSKDAIPIMVPQLVELKKQLANLNTQTKESSASETSPSGQKGSVPGQSGSSSSANTAVKPIPKNFSQPRTAALGTAGIDETTGTVLTVKRTSPDRTATLILSFPDRAQSIEEQVYAGKQFKFAWGGKTIVLTIMEIQFLSDTVTYRLQISDA